MKTHHVLIGGDKDQKSLEENLNSTLTISNRLKKKSTGVLHSLNGHLSSNSQIKREDMKELTKNMQPESFALFPPGSEGQDSLEHMKYEAELEAGEYMTLEEEQ